MRYKAVSKTKSTGLGRGFDSLIPHDFDKELLSDNKDRIQKLLISQVRPNPQQPRRHFDTQALTELSESIKRYGILQPIIVSGSGSEDNYIIVAGERRWRAAQLSNLAHIPAIIRDQAELEQLEIALIENVQRVDLSPLEQAASIEKLHQQFNMNYSEIAGRLGKATTTVNNIVRLLQLPSEAIEALRSGAISEGHARSILSLKNNTHLQLELLKRIKKLHWSVRQAEQFVTATKTSAASAMQAASRIVTETPETKKLTKILGLPVAIRRTAKGGRLELRFRSDQELAQILKRLLN